MLFLLCCRLPLNWGTRPRYIDEYIYFVFIFFHCSMKKFKQFSKKKKKKKKNSAENRRGAEWVNVGDQYLLVFIVRVSYWHLLIFISGC